MTTEAPNGRDGSRSRDLSYAIVTMVFAMIMAGIFLYGAWWRRSESKAFYRSTFDEAWSEYEGVLEGSLGEDENPVELFQQGSRVDLVFKRISQGEDDIATNWQHAQFLSRHANRIERLTLFPERWESPGQVEEAKQRVRKYRDRAKDLTEEVSLSTSPLKHDAALQQLEESALGAFVGRDVVNESLTKLNELISLGEESESPGSPRLTNPDTRERAAMLSIWLCLDSAWSSASPLTPLVAEDGRLTESIGRLSDVRRRIESEPFESSSRQKCLAFADVACLMLRMQSDELTDESSRRDNERLFDQTLDLMPLRWSASQLTDLLPVAISFCVRSRWAELGQMLAELRRKNDFGDSETDSFERCVARIICRLSVAGGRQLIPEDARAGIAEGIDMAISLDGSSAETCSLLFTIGSLRSNERKSMTDETIANRFKDVVEHTLSNPSRSAFLVSAAISAGLDRDGERLAELTETGEMLRSQLPARVGFVSLWRFRVTEGEKNGHGDSPGLDEAKAWVDLLNGLIGGRESSDFESVGYGWLALAAWQLRSGDSDAGGSNLNLAREKLGPSPLVGQIEQAYAILKSAE